MTETMLIPLTRDLFATVSAVDYEWLMRYKWCATPSSSGKNFYACTRVAKPGGGQRTIFMHRHILGLEVGDKRWGDHINTKETLNNTRENLRIASANQSAQNRGRRVDCKSGCTGVWFTVSSGRWRVRIKVDNKNIHIGSFATFEEAVKARKAAEAKYYGEFAHQEAA